MPKSWRVNIIILDEEQKILREAAKILDSPNFRLQIAITPDLPPEQLAMVKKYIARSFGAILDMNEQVIQ